MKFMARHLPRGHSGEAENVPPLLTGAKPWTELVRTGLSLQPGDGGLRHPWGRQHRPGLAAVPSTAEQEPSPEDKSLRPTSTAETSGPRGCPGGTPGGPARPAGQ